MLAVGLLRRINPVSRIFVVVWTEWPGSIRLNSCVGLLSLLWKATHADVIDALGHVARDGTAHAAPRRVPTHLREVWRPAGLPHDESGKRVLRGNFHVRVRELDAVDPGLNSAVSDSGSRVGLQQHFPLVPAIANGFDVPPTESSLAKTEVFRLNGARELRVDAKNERARSGSLQVETNARPTGDPEKQDLVNARLLSLPIG